MTVRFSQPLLSLSLSSNSVGREGETVLASLQIHAIAPNQRTARHALIRAFNAPLVPSPRPNGERVRERGFCLTETTQIPQLAPGGFTGDCLIFSHQRLQNF